MPFFGFSVRAGFAFSLTQILRLPRLLFRSRTASFTNHSYSDKLAIIDSNEAYTYDNLKSFAEHLSQSLLNEYQVSPSRPIALLLPRDVSFVSGLLASWKLGAAVVPLDAAYPDDEIRYFIERSASGTVLCLPESRSRLEGMELPEYVKIPPLEKTAYISKNDVSSLKTPENTLNEPGASDLLPFLANNHKDMQIAVILFTSGTTAKPKAVGISHGNLRHRISAMQKMWKWDENDCILHCLPLNHVHGLENALLTPFASGATCFMLPTFHPKQVWDALLDSPPQLSAHGRRVNMFTSVPTVYGILIEYFRNNFAKDEIMKKRIYEVCRQYRLMISGSASLPSTISQVWKNITGQRLLERYGMTEVGMALGQLMHLPEDMQVGSVGRPFPHVNVRVVSSEQELLLEADHSNTTIHSADEKITKWEGELQIHGPLIFKEYLGMPNETKETFTDDGWFKTGDIVSYDTQTSLFSIMGRASIDIIKHGGHKLSALQIERTLLEHEYVAEAAVFGVPDELRGETIVAILRLHPEYAQRETDQLVDTMQQWCKSRLPKFSVPHSLHFSEIIPKNNLGKIDKKVIKRDYLSSHS